MTIKARPIHNRMFVKFDDPAKRTRGDLWLPDSSQTAKRTGTIVGIGPGMEDSTGVFHPTTLKVGDHVLIGNYAGTEIKIGDEQVHVMRETDVIAMETLRIREALSQPRSGSAAQVRTPSTNRSS